jgi:uncharacterized protein YegL
VYFLIDISESMIGEPIQQVEEGLANIIKELKMDPFALETVWVSIIIFAGSAKTLVPLQEIVSFYPPKFPIGSGTSLSHGLGQLMFELRRNIVKTTMEQKGDWKPIVFLFTDGVPTDDTRGAIAEWQKNWKGSVNMVAVALGDQTDVGLLGQLTENVLFFNDNKSSSYKEFFKWVTASIKTNSIAVEQNPNHFDLLDMEGGTLSKVDLKKEPTNKTYVDDHYVVIAAKCQNTKRPYLMKYRKTKDQSTLMWGQNTMYKLVGAFQVDQSYYELSDETRTTHSIHTDKLIGSPTCPCCGNQIAFALCQCGGIHCIDIHSVNTCPWCGNQGRYGVGEGGFNVDRTQG